MISAKKKNFIIEYRPTAIRIARVSSDFAPAVIEDVLEIDLLKEDDFQGKLRSFAGVKANGFLHASCSVYPKSRIVRHLQIDSGRGKEGQFVLDYLKSQVGIDPDEYSVFCLSANDGIDAELSAFNKKAILLCGVDRTEVQTLQEELVAASVYPSRLEIGSVGTIGALKELVSKGEDASPMLFLEVDSEYTDAVIVGPKGVEMARRIDGGSDLVAAALKEEMNLKDDSAAEKILRSKDFDLGPLAPKILRKILRELQSSIGFFEVQTGLSVSRLHCTSKGRQMKWMQDSICDLLNLAPIDCDLPKWLGERSVTFSSEELAARVDETWIGLFAQLVEMKKEQAA